MPGTHRAKLDRHETKIGKAELNRAGGLMSHATSRSRDPEPDYAAALADADCYAVWHGDVPLFEPWRRDDNICEGAEEVRLLSLNDPARLYFLAALSRHAMQLDGAFGECGVFRGGTALLMARVTESVGTELHLIDSFDGLPDPDTSKDTFYQRGDFRFADSQCVIGLLSEAGARVHVHRGWVPQVFSVLPTRRWALIHVDMDLYQPTLDACDYFYDRMTAGGVMVFDEYGFPTCRGERDAVDTFFSGRREAPIVLPTGQAFVLKL